MSEQSLTPKHIADIEQEIAAMQKTLEALKDGRLGLQFTESGHPPVDATSAHIEHLKRVISEYQGILFRNRE